MDYGKSVNVSQRVSKKGGGDEREGDSMLSLYKLIPDAGGISEISHEFYGGGGSTNAKRGVRLSATSSNYLFEGSVRIG